MNTWAIIRTGGKQYKVAESDVIDVEKEKVKEKVIEEFKGKKIRVVKFKAKSHYRKAQGHRQAKTKVLIEKIQF